MLSDGERQSPKRIKLDNDSELLAPALDGHEEEDTEQLDEDENGESCSICLGHLEDRTVIPPCSHEFCFECLVVWTGKVARTNYPTLGY